MPLSDIPGRCVDGKNEFCALSGLFFDGIATVALPFPILLVVPRIFADHERHFRIADGAKMLLSGRSEIANLVEHVIVWKKHFGLAKHDSSALDDDGGILGSE